MKMASAYSKVRTIIGSLWLFAGILYFLNHVAFLGSLGVPAPLSQWIDLPIILAARVILVTWTFGVIVEMLSHENNVPSLQSFKKNLKSFWWLAALTLLVPQILHFLIFLTSRLLLPRPVLEAFLILPVTYGAAYFLIAMKYKTLVTKKLKEPRLSPARLAEGAVILFLCLTTALFLPSENLLPFFRPIPELLLHLIFFISFTIFAANIIDTNPAITQRFSAERTLILINLPAGGIVLETLANLFLHFYPPFFTVLKALTPQRYRILEYNRALWLNPAYQGGALVSITCFTSNCAEAYRIAKEFRRQGSTVIMGGPHVSFFPEEALAFCDSVVVGAAESIWEDVIRDFENGALQKLYRGVCSEEGQRRTHDFLLNAPAEIAADFLLIKRGCKFNCYFCANPALTDKSCLQKSLDDILALIRKVSQTRKTFALIDNNIYADPAYAKEFFRALAPLKLNWTTSASIDIAQDDEALRLLKDAGCGMLLIGYEIDAASLEQEKGGKLNMAKNYIALSRKIQKSGIRIKAHFIFGFPGDSWKTLARLWWFCFRLSPTITALSFLTPLPGARFFDDTARQGKLFNLNWRDFDLDHQVCDHAHLGRSWALQKAFPLFVGLFFLTTSWAGRTITGFFIILPICLHFFH